MSWYLAKIIYRIICGNGNHTPQFDEQLRLISAANEEDAFFKAQALGQQEEDCFMNIRQQEVRWQFINVGELYRLSAMIDGAEVYSRIRETDDADAYIQMVNQKAISIQEKESHQLLHLF